MQPSLHKRVYGPGFFCNANFDTLLAFKSQSGGVFPRHSDREVQDVKPGEILICQKKGAGGRTGTARVISFLNGLGGADKDEVRTNICRDYSFFGVAEGEHKSSGKYDVQGLSVKVGGLVTVLNEGPSTIHPGAKIVVDTPDEIYAGAGRRGIHPQKARLIFREWRYVEKDGKPADVVGRTCLAVVGSAKSFAKQGSRFELLLHHRAY